MTSPAWARLAAPYALFTALVALHVGYTSSQLTVGIVAESLNAWDVVLSSLNGPYFIVYVAIPALLLANHRTVLVAGDPTALIRHGSRAAAAFAHGLAMARRAAAGVVLWIAISAIGATSRGWSRDWSAAAGSPQNSDRLVTHTLAAALSPAAAVVAQAAMLIVSAWLVATALAMVHLRTDSVRTLRWASAGVMVAAILSFQAGQWLPPLLKPVNYFYSAQAIHDTGSVVHYLCATLVGGAALLVGFRWTERHALPAPSAAQRRWLVLVAILLASLWLMVRWAAPRTDDAGDALAFVFTGAGEDGFSIVPFGFILLVAIGPAYVVHAGLVDRLNGGLYTELIRYGSPSRWLARRLLGAAGASLAIVLALLAAHFLAFTALTGGLGTATSVSLGGFHFAVNGALQTFVYAVLLLAVTWATGRIGSGLWVIGAVLVLALPGPLSWLLFPAALNSMSVVAGGAADVVRATVVLLAWLAAALVVLFVAARRRDISFE